MKIKVIDLSETVVFVKDPWSNPKWLKEHGYKPMIKLINVLETIPF